MRRIIDFTRYLMPVVEVFIIWIAAVEGFHCYQHLQVKIVQADSQARSEKESRELREWKAEYDRQFPNNNL